MTYSLSKSGRDLSHGPGRCDRVNDTAGAISYFFNKQNLKLQGDITNTHDQGKGRVDDMTYRVQAQVIF